MLEEVVNNIEDVKYAISQYISELDTYKTVVIKEYRLASRKTFGGEDVEQLIEIRDERLAREYELQSLATEISEQARLLYPGRVVRIAEIIE